MGVFAEMRLAGREQSPTLAGKKGVTKPSNANEWIVKMFNFHMYCD